jgi:hypothetical protein
MIVEIIAIQKDLKSISKKVESILFQLSATVEPGFGIKALINMKIVGVIIKSKDKIRKGIKKE